MSKTPPALPQTGGSWTRDPKGGLKKAEGAAETKPDTAAKSAKTEEKS